MTKPITTLSLVLNALLIAWILFNHYKKDEPSEPQGPNLNALINLPQTEPIKVDSANTFHRQYYLNRADAINDKTRAVFFSFKNIVSPIFKNYKSNKSEEAINWLDFLEYLMAQNFYAYLGKYDKNYHPIPDTDKYKHPANNSTVIIQFAKEDGSVIENEIYDFGTLCPDHCPQNEQITEPK